MAGKTLAALVVALTSFVPGVSIGYTPESLEVKQMLARAVGFLQSDAATDPRMGAKPLIGLALIKSGVRRDHPKVVEAVQVIQDSLRGAEPASVSVDIYSTGLSVIFLVTLDPEQYRPEVQLLVDSLRARQKPHGGWGYPERQNGDTSMTQYAVLSFWEATQAGLQIAPDSIEKAATWILKTQDPSGAFGYQALVADGFAPVAQSGISLSTTAAGMGSLYICMDLLGLVRASVSRDDLPLALQRVEGPESLRPAYARTRLDPQLFRNVQMRGTGWFQANFRIDPPAWTHYYLYALERYMSFRELAEGRIATQPGVSGPAWYDQGVEFLAKTQAQDGSWKSDAGQAVDTAFGALFLLRSSRKSIEKARGFGPGLLVGGRGLPKETARAEVRLGKVVARPLLGPAEELLAAMDKEAPPEMARAIDELADLPLEQVEALFGQRVDKLCVWAKDPAAETRLAAVRMMGKTRKLDYVPALIDAMSDPDPGVVREAEESLCRIGRRLKGFYNAEDATEENREAAIARWKAWYLAVRPEAEIEP